MVLKQGKVVVDSPVQRMIPNFFAVKIIRLAQSGDFVKYSELHVDDHDVSYLLNSLPDDGIGPQRLAEANDEYEKIMACLTKRQREYIVLLVEGYSYSEIAQKMGVGYGYLRNMWHRIRDRLRLHGYGDGYKLPHGRK